MKQIGKGSSGVVYSCTSNGNVAEYVIFIILIILIGWMCAMKEVYVNDEGSIAELAALEKIPVHENLVQYFTHRIVDDKMQLFLRLYSGTLKDIINERALKNNLFTPMEIMKILLDIARGLNALHKHKIIHRGM